MRWPASPRSATATCSTASSAPCAVPFGPALLFAIEGLAGGSAVVGEADLLDLRLVFAQLGIAVALQRGAAFVVADGAVQRALALLQLADDRLQLVERLFERNRAAIAGKGVFCHGSCLRCRPF